MGCETSTIRGTDQDLDMNQQQFKLTYRQFIMNSRGQVFDFYHFSTMMHRSHTGVIRKVFHRTNKTQRVCKIISVQNLRQLSCVQEVQVLKNLEHPNVIKIYEYFIEKHFFYMIFELIKGSSLHDSLTTLKQISLENVISIMKQLLSVVNMMHSQNIAHRGIHPGHIMLQSKDKYFIVKLIDFSSSAFSMSPKLTSPKPYRYQQAYNRKQSEKNPLKYDVYCCGLIFLTLLGGSRHLKNICGRQEETIKQVLAKTPIVQGLESILCSMLKANPQQRSTSLSVLNHQLFNETLNKKEDKILLRNLRQFNVKGKLKSTLWMFATIKLQTLYNRIDLMNEFYSLDKNKDGKIQFQQLSEGLMNTFAISQAQANKQTQRIFKKIDKNNNGEMDFYEFVMGAYVVGKNLSDSQLRLVFNEIDANKDGVITSQELNEAIQGIDEFDLLASNGNKLDFENFKKIMKSYIARISGANNR